MLDKKSLALVLKLLKISKQVANALGFGIIPNIYCAE
jgi:hypothetical protein